MPAAKVGAAAVATLAIGLAACGDDDEDTTTAREPSAKTTTPKAPDLGRFLMRKDEEPGFRQGALPDASPAARETVTGAEAFAQSPAEERELREEGFISFTVQPIRGPRDTAGLSNVSLFETAEGAKRHLARTTSTAAIRAPGPLEGLRRFTVPGVPGARGWTASEPPVGNVYWVQGRCVLVLGNQGPGRLSGPLSKGARAIYERTNGNCP